MAVPRSSADRPAISIGLFLVSLTALLIEVLLTRIFDVILTPHLAFMVITCAMFGLALGGLFDVALGTRGRPALDRPGQCFALATWALSVLLNHIPFSLDRLGRQPFLQSTYFLLLYLVLVAPFFFAGLCLCRIFSSRPAEIQRLYGWDLIGAAVGAAVLIPLLPRLGPERLLLLGGIVGLVASVLLADRRSWLLSAGLAIAAIVVPRALGDRYLTLSLHDNKRNARRAIEAGRLEFLRWDAVSTIAVLDQPRATSSPFDHGRKHIAYDGGTQSSDFFPFDGDFTTLRRDLTQRVAFQFWRRSVLASHYLRRDTGHTALIIGGAGGQETKATLLYGASHVDTVEMVGTMVELATGPYSTYIGRLFQHPRVAPHVGEGRSFLRASRATYDVIQIFSNYTSSSLASGSGALAPDYLLTTDAYTEYFAHLKANGVLQINHVAYPRMIATAATAWSALGRDNFRSHVLVHDGLALCEPYHQSNTCGRVRPTHR